MFSKSATAFPRVQWIKSSYSGPRGNCVELAWTGSVAVRDSKDLGAGVLYFPAGAWSLFAAAVAAEGGALPGRRRIEAV